MTTVSSPSSPPFVPVSDDAWAEADNAKWDPTYTVFGEVDLNISYVVLQKGIGKVAFVPTQHQQDERRVSIEITIIPVIPGRQNVQRDMLSQSREWANIVNQSIKAFGPNWNAQMLKGRYVEAQLVPSGRKYRTADGDERDATTVKFVRFFNGEDDCAAAAVARRGGSSNGATSAAAVTPAAETPVNAHERATVAQFLGPLWKSCNGDADKFGALLKNPPFATYFTLTSPEVLALVMPATTPADETEKLPF